METAALNAGRTGVVARKDAAEAMNKIFAYSFAKVRERILKENSIPKKRVDTAIYEFMKYLSLIARGYTGLGMISRDVDEVWHTFILFTQDYTDFCHEVFGRYLHHSPNTSYSPLGPEPRERFLMAYQEVYGDLPKIWQDANGNTCFSSCDTPSTACQEPRCS